jgi:hypothetical protein
VSPKKHERRRRWRNREIRVWAGAPWITNFTPPPGGRITFERLQRRAQTFLNEHVFGTWVQSDDGTYRRVEDYDELFALIYGVPRDSIEAMRRDAT